MTAPSPRELSRRLDALPDALNWQDVIRGRERLEADATDRLEDLEPLARDTARRLHETIQEMRRRGGA